MADPIQDVVDGRQRRAPESPNRRTSVEHRSTDLLPDAHHPGQQPVTNPSPTCLRDEG